MVHPPAQDDALLMPVWDSYLVTISGYASAWDGRVGERVRNEARERG
jgi:hypothetical protein